MRQQFALVTGSSSGLGLEMSHYLIEEGFVVFGASRSGTDIDHESFVDLEVDVREEESVIAMYDAIGERTFGLNLIVNNAGIFDVAPLVETTSEDFINHLLTNLVGPYHVLKHGHAFLIENITHVINISSIASKKGFENTSAYCASKFGLNGMIESVQEEWKSLGIRFTTLLPGAIDTPLWESLSSEFERSKMLDPEDFLHVFDMVVKAPPNMQFKEISFLHKSGVID